MHNRQTPYHKKVAAHLASSKKQWQREKSDRYLQIDRFLCCFENAWKEYYQQEIVVTYRHGWYYLHKERLRKGEIEIQLAALLAKLHELESPSGEE